MKRFNLSRIGGKYLKDLPIWENKKNQAFSTLVFTLVACSIFGFFAISPTLSTIAHLKKELKDNKLVDQKLDQKISNLGILQNKYSVLREDLQVVDLAIPEKPDAPLFIAQMQALTKENNLNLKALQVNEVELTKPSKTSIGKYFSFAFSIDASGNFSNISDFIFSLISLERITAIDTVNIKSSEKNALDDISIRGKLFFE